MWHCHVNLQKMDSRYSAPRMRSLTFLILTVSSATWRSGNSPTARAVATAPRPPRRRASTEARLAQCERLASLARAGFEGEIESIAAQLLMATQMQTQASQALDALRSGQVAEANRVAGGGGRAPAPRADRPGGRNGPRCFARSSPRCAIATRSRSGYMGITFSATMRADAGASGGEVFRFAENPTVETVEPGSPAERAGVAKGDEIILIDGQSVVGRDIVFTQTAAAGYSAAAPR